jgi:Family of unknown function (DUF5670)
MGRLINTVALILILGWLVGFFVFHIGAIIHVLLVVGIVMILVRAVKDRQAI